MLKQILAIIFLLSSVAIADDLRELSRKPLNIETFREWDEYIKKYAPSDSAFSLLVTFANRHHFSGRSILAREVFSMYKPLFPEKSEIFEGQEKVLAEFAMTQPVTNDLIGYFVKFINQNAPDNLAFVAVQRLSEQFLNRRDWDSAAFIFRTFKPLFPEMNAKIDQILTIIEAPERNVVIRNLGQEINTGRNEWDPNPTPDGSKLYFSADNRRGGFGGSDVWFSEMKDGIWQKPQNAGNRINGKNDETIDNITIDGNGMLLSGTFDGTFGKFDIYFKELTESGWSSLYHFPYPINSKYTDEGGNFTADSKALLFSSDRPGGIGDFKEFGELLNGNNHGNMDIYVCLKTENGWSEPINLGETINTPFSERSPFLHPDGKTLYFSSEGHPGLGRLDVFKSVRLREDSWTEWSEPVNLGKEINSGGDDWGYKISISGDSAFFAGLNRQDGFGGWDLYSITLPQEAKPEKVVVIRGKVLTPQGFPLAVDMIWEDLESGEIAGKLKSNPMDGSYFIALPQGKLYGYYAERRGFYPASNNIDLREKKDYESFYKDIVLYSVAEMRKNQTPIPIKNIFFDFDKSELKPESFNELNRLADFVKTNKIKSIRIEGHTDDLGAAGYNDALSLKRAEAVKEYLVARGIKNENISTIGFGSSKPQSNNETEENRAKNRRVEIVFE